MMGAPIHITTQAAKAINSRIERAPDGTIGLRLNVKPTGCSGNSYAMEYVTQDHDISGDDCFEQKGATLFVPKTVSWMLFGIEIDFGMDELGNESFQFINPNEVGRCGCGESFQVNKTSEPVT